MALLLCIVCFVIAFLIVCSNYEEMAVIPFFISAGLLILVIISAFNVVEGRVIDNKIAMYQEENKNIEDQMDVLVKKYMDYESETFGELKNESSIALVSLYPELKADELVKSQVEVYTSNNKKVKELKEKKINLSVWKWWLYFGG